MNGKMLIKVTLNEATDPDLFAYLSQFENARLRAGAFRSIAGAAVRGDRAQSALPLRGLINEQGSSTTMLTGSQSGYSRPAEMPKSMPDASAAAIRTEPAFASDLPSVALSPPSARRFDTDAIGEQFADF
ncbi:hypothetical protein [Paraburkholderia aromaticivorans]|uniref:hypothetical protein n=1 Tax=Paraburkholderia aromaticivorans TaxID=2026199 RepID=UPI0038BD094F